MAQNINSVVLVGNLTKDPELRLLLLFSARMIWQPAARSLSCWIARSWSSVDTRA